MELAGIVLAVAGGVATLAGSWYIGDRARLRAALSTAEEIIGMLAVKVNLLESQIRDLKEKIGDE